MRLELDCWDEAELPLAFPRAFLPLLPPQLQLKGCSGLEGTLRSLGAVGGGEEACEGTGALAGEGPGVLHLQL